MQNKIRQIYDKHRELILYVFFGGLTTLVNIITFTLLAGLPENFPLFKGYAAPLTGKTATVAATVIAWIVSVLFAYVTNRRWVFVSRASGGARIAAEIGAFFAARVFSGLLDVGIMCAFADLLGLNKLAVKIASNILVIIINYVLSKFWIFKKAKQ